MDFFTRRPQLIAYSRLRDKVNPLEVNYSGNCTGVGGMHLKTENKNRFFYFWLGRV